MGKTPMLIEGKEVELEKTSEDEKEPEQGAKDSPAETLGTKSGKLEEDGKKYVNDFLADYAEQVFGKTCSGTFLELTRLLGADVLVTSPIKLSGTYMCGFKHSCAPSIPENAAQDFLKKYLGPEVVQSDFYASLKGEVPLDKLVSQVPELEEVKKIMFSGEYLLNFHPYVAVLGLPHDLRWLPAVAIGGRGIKEFTSFSLESDQSKEGLKNLFQQVCFPSSKELFSAAFAYGVKEIMPVRSALNKLLEEYVGMLK